MAAFQILTQKARALCARYNYPIVDLEVLMLTALDNPTVHSDLTKRTGVDVSKISAELLEHIQSTEFLDTNTSQVGMSAEAADLIVSLARNTPNLALQTEEFKAVTLIIGITNRYPLSKAAQTMKSYGISLGNQKQLPANIPPQANSTTQPSQTSDAQKTPSEALAEFTLNLNDLARQKKLPPTIGRDDEIQQVIRILRRKTKSNPALLGEAGVGKTAIIEGLAQMAADGTLPEDLKDLKIFSLDMGTLVAETKFRGDFEKRLKAVIAGLTELKNAVLFVDELHLLMGAGATSGNTMDAANLLKPALARGDIKLIGATTYDEYRKYIKKDKALERRFNTVDVKEPSLEDALKIVTGIKDYYGEYHNCHVTDEAVQAAIDLSHKHLRNRRLPDKAIDILDGAGALLKETSQDDLTFDKDSGKPLLTREIVTKAIALQTGLPLEKITASDRTKILSLKDALNEAVLGQPKPVEAIADAYMLSRSGLGDANKPIGSFLFSGPTGVGKTELSKQLAHHLDIPMVRLDMSEYMEKTSVAKLIGAPPGYVGYDEGGALTEPVNRQGHCVLLLDEIEKAHPDVFNILLQVMDEGHLTDSSGNKVDFRNVILIMTSNAGTGGEVKRSIGFGKTKESSTKDDEIKGTFPPEFRNRLDGEITFNKLTPEVMIEIVEKVTQELADKLAEQNISLDIKPDAAQWLAENGFDSEMGARPLKRVFEKHVKLPIARKLLELDNNEGRQATVSAQDDGLTVTLGNGAANDNTSKQQTLPSVSLTMHMLPPPR